MPGISAALSDDYERPCPPRLADPAWCLVPGGSKLVSNKMSDFGTSVKLTNFPRSKASAASRSENGTASF
jgi:hypothetical protein